jgi:hypothetical protein
MHRAGSRCVRQQSARIIPTGRSLAGYLKKSFRPRDVPCDSIHLGSSAPLSNTFALLRPQAPDSNVGQHCREAGRQSHQPIAENQICLFAGGGGNGDVVLAATSWGMLTVTGSGDLVSENVDWLLAEYSHLVPSASATTDMVPLTIRLLPGAQRLVTSKIGKRLECA